jgi:hypothetical protein
MKLDGFTPVTEQQFYKFLDDYEKEHGKKLHRNTVRFTFPEWATFEDFDLPGDEMAVAKFRYPAGEHEAKQYYVRSLLWHPTMRKRANILILQSGGAAAAPVYTISGTVYDADGTTAVSGATVALGALSAVSAANGTYTIADVPLGASGSMTCTKAGYSWTAITVAAMSGNLAAQNYTNLWYAAGGTLANCIIAYKPIGAANLAASYVNLANPGTYNAAPVTAGGDPTFAAATGWQFIVANTDRLKTGWVPPNQVARTGIARISGATIAAANRYVFGCRDAPGTDTWFALLNTNGTSVAQFRNGTGTTYIHSAGITDGVVAISGLDPYKDAVDLGGITAGTYNLGARELFVGCLNSNGSTTGYFDGYIQAIAFYDIALNATQIGILSTAMAALTNP